MLQSAAQSWTRTQRVVRPTARMSTSPTRSPLRRPAAPTPRRSLIRSPLRRPAWLRTHGVNTNGAAAKVMNLARSEKGTSWHSGEYRFNGSTKKSLSTKPNICSDPISVEPICPFPTFPKTRGGSPAPFGTPATPRRRPATEARRPIFAPSPCHTAHVGLHQDTCAARARKSANMASANMVSMALTRRGCKDRFPGGPGSYSAWPGPAGGSGAVDQRAELLEVVLLHLLTYWLISCCCCYVLTSLV